MNLDNFNQLVIAVSSRALFDLETEHQIFEQEGYNAFEKHQLENQDCPLKPGAAFPFVKQLLTLNKRFSNQNLIRVIALSRNSPVTARRFFNSCKFYDLPINAGAFTSGFSTFPYLKAFNVSLFLSANEDNVKKAVNEGIPAGLVIHHPESSSLIEPIEEASLRIAFDFDGVVAGDESEREFQASGLEKYIQFEKDNASKPHTSGPLRSLFEKLSLLQKLDYELHGQDNPYYHPAIRISIVTARGAQSEERLITTLKQFGMNAVELFLLDGQNKGPILAALQPHIFFDDQIRNLEGIRNDVPSVLVPFGIHNEFST